LKSIFRERNVGQGVYFDGSGLGLAVGSSEYVDENLGSINCGGILD